MGEFTRGGQGKWDSIGKENTLSPTALVAYDPDVTGYVPVTVDQIVGVSNTVNVEISGDNANSATNAAIGTSNGVLFNLNASRVAYLIQNLQTGSLAVKYGSGISPTSFNLILAGGALVDDGIGGYVSDTDYRGIVSVSGLNGITPRYSYTEFV